MNKKSYSLSFFIFLIILPFAASSATYYSRINGNWNTASTWSLVSCSGVASGSVPTAADNVIICSGKTVTMNGSPGTCLSLTVNGTANWTSATAVTNVGLGGLTLNNGSVLSGTAAGSLNVAGPMNVTAGAIVTISAIALNVTGLTSINGRMVDTGISGSYTFTNVNLNATGRIDNSSAESYTITGNLDTYGGTFTSTSGGAPTFNIGNFNVVSGTCDLSRISVIVSGNTTVSGTLLINGVRGVKTFNNFTVNPSGSFITTVVETFTFNGDITINGVFNASLGIYVLQGSGKIISGSTAITVDDVTCNGYYTNNANVRITTSFRGLGTWAQGATGIITLETSVGSFGITNFYASSTGNTVIYNRSSNQIVVTPNDGSYYNLTVSNGSSKSLAATTIVNGTLTISSATTLSVSGSNLTVGGNFTNNGTFSAGSTSVTLNGTAAQTIGGTSVTAFNNLIIANTNAVVTGATSFSVATTLNINAGAILSPNATVLVSGAGTLTGNGIARVTRVAATADFITQYTIAGKILAGLNIDYIGAGNQSVNILNYGSLTISTNGTRTVTFPVGIVGVSNVFSPTSITTNYVITGNTVTFNGTISQSVPAFTYNNLISAGSAAKTLSGNIVVNNDITITSNLDVSASNYSISVKRNWINNGTFNAQNGAVVFNGTVAQTLSGTGTTTFNQLDMNNTAGGVSLTSGTYILNSVINPLNGNFNTNGQSFTMVSDAARTARIGQVAATASLSGNFIIQRYITARDTSFADLCSPVQSSSVLDWDNELPAISYTHTPPSALASAFTYDETADVYVPITSSSAPLNPGQGIEIFLAGDYTYASLPNTTIDAVGVPNQGDKNLSSLISNNVQGWNLVGNPYASNVSWASIYTASGGAASGLYDFIEMYDYTIGDWNGYTSADGIEIGSAQGFWVYGLPLTSPLTLIIPESSKTATSNSTIKAPTKTYPYFTLKISSEMNNFSHTFKVDSKNGASDNLDAQDLPYRASPNKATPTLYSIVGGTNVNLNTFNSENETYSMPLIVKVNATGNYKISAAGFEFMDEYKCFQLEDRLKNSLINLTSQNIYEFEMFKLEDEKRFVLHFNKNGNCKQSIASEEEDPYFDNSVEVLANQQGNVLNFNYSEVTNTSISVYNLLGQDVVEKRNLAVSNQSETILLPDDFKGIYFIQVSSDKGTIVKKFFKK